MAQCQCLQPPLLFQDKGCWWVVNNYMTMRWRCLSTRPQPIQRDARTNGILVPRQRDSAPPKGSITTTQLGHQDIHTRIVLMPVGADDQLIGLQSALPVLSMIWGMVDHTPDRVCIEPNTTPRFDAKVSPPVSFTPSEMQALIMFLMLQYRCSRVAASRLLAYDDPGEGASGHGLQRFLIDDSLARTVSLFPRISDYESVRNAVRDDIPRRVMDALHITLNLPPPPVPCDPTVDRHGPMHSGDIAINTKVLFAAAKLRRDLDTSSVTLAPFCPSLHRNDIAAFNLITYLMWEYRIPQIKLRPLMTWLYKTTGLPQTLYYRARRALGVLSRFMMFSPIGLGRKTIQ